VICSKPYKKLNHGFPATTFTEAVCPHCCEVLPWCKHVKPSKTTIQQQATFTISSQESHPSLQVKAASLIC